MFLAIQASTEQATHYGLKTSEWIMVAAVIVGPIFAVLTQLFWQRWRVKQDQKLWVFGTLMSLRAAALSPDYVRALNYIDVVFYKNQKVRDRWKTLLDFLASEPWKADTITQDTLDRTRDLTAELLAEIAKDLGYEYDHTHIKQNAYLPKGHGTLEQEQATLRKAAIGVLEGNRSLHVLIRDN